MRWLVSLADRVVATAGRVSVRVEGGARYEIIENPALAITPFELQGTHCCVNTAEALVIQYPGEWQIVDEAEIRELDRLWNLS